MSTPLPYLFTEKSVTIFTGSDQQSVPSTHIAFEDIKSAIRKGAWDDIPSLLDSAKAVREFLGTSGHLTLVDGVILWDNEPITGAAIDHIFRMKAEGFDAAPLIAFVERLQANPSMRVRTDLFDWLIGGNMPITPDGYVLAFKKVNNDYKDYRSKTFSNKIGDVCEVDRASVDDDIENTCSYGLHFCSRGYLPHYYGNQGHVMAVQIDPADIVAFPRDYNLTKGRCRKYTVVGEVPEAEVGDAFGTSVNSDYFFAPDEDDYLDQALITRSELVEEYGEYGQHDVYDRGDHAKAQSDDNEGNVSTDYWAWVIEQIKADAD